MRPEVSTEKYRRIQLWLREYTYTQFNRLDVRDLEQSIWSTQRRWFATNGSRL